MKNFLLLLAMFGLSAAWSVAHADGELQSELKAFLVTVDDSGNESLTPASEAEPNQVLEYRLVYTNKSETAYKNLIINGMVPANTEYVAKSSGSEVKHNLVVSINRGNTYQAEPVMRKIKLADGTEKEEVVPASEYTNLRWKSQEAIQPEQKQTFTYRVRVK